MCFSAGASFGAGVILTAIGVASVRKVESRSEIPFAGIPLIFAVQQFTEGFLWLALSNPVYAALKGVTTYTFLFFAQVVWPLWVPLSIMLIEKKTERKRVLKLLTGIGVVVSAYLLFCLISFPVSASISRYHISYSQDYPSFIGLYLGVFYFIATIAPPFFSRNKYMWTLGAAILVSYIITIILYRDYVVSVWCFFASVISIAVFAIMMELKKKNRMSAQAALR